MGFALLYPWSWAAQCRAGKDSSTQARAAPAGSAGGFPRIFACIRMISAWVENAQTLAAQGFCRIIAFFRFILKGIFSLLLFYIYIFGRKPVKSMPFVFRKGYSSPVLRVQRRYTGTDAKMQKFPRPPPRSVQSLVGNALPDQTGRPADGFSPGKSLRRLDLPRPVW